MSTLTILDCLNILWVIIRLPFKILSSVVFSPFLKRYKKKRLIRVIAEASTTFMVGNFSIHQMQQLLGTTLDAYKSWAKNNGVLPVIEDVRGNAKLLWLTEKRERVLVYVHGGAFMFPTTAPLLSFPSQIHEELERSGAQDFSVVALTYSLYPQQFPTQLNEVTLALTHLLSSGIKQENVILLADSAGANLITQFLVHTLHPVEGVAPSPLRSLNMESTKPLRGVCLISPWLSLDTQTSSHQLHDEFDYVRSVALLHWGKTYLENVSKTCFPWVKPLLCAPDADEHWFSGLQEYVQHMLLVAGGKECLLDDSKGMYAALKNLPNSDLMDVRLELIEDGLHDEPLLGFAVNEMHRGMIQIRDWIGECFAY